MERGQDAGSVRQEEEEGTVGMRGKGFQAGAVGTLRVYSSAMEAVKQSRIF